MALKLKLSQFSDISASILTNSDKLPILQYNGSDYANKTITIETLKDELFRDGGVSIVGDSYITGNLFISGSLVSEQIISSSTVDIGDNIILLNTLSGSPKRYAGIEVIDSGSSPNISSSFLWDSQNNYWILTSLSSSNLILTTITSSNISASGTISGSTLHGTTSVTSPIGNFTNLTASNISASGAISGSTLHGATSVTSPIGNFTNITASNISASSAISGSTLHGTTSVTSPIGNFTNLTASNISASNNIDGNILSSRVISVGIGNYIIDGFSIGSNICIHPSQSNNYSVLAIGHTPAGGDLSGKPRSSLAAFYSNNTSLYSGSIGLFYGADGESSARNIVWLDGKSYNVGIGTGFGVQPPEKLTVSGSISASGAISGSTLHGATSVTSPIGNFTNITASNISASNNITTNTLIISGSVSSPANTTISGTLKTYKPSYGFDTNGPSNTGITYTVPSFTDLYDLNVRQSLNVDGIINCDTGSYDYIRINDIDIHTISFGAYYDSSGGSIQSTTYNAVDLENNNIINVAQIELDKGSKTDVSIPNIYSNNSIDIISNGFTTRFSNTGISASGEISGSTLHGVTSVTSPIGNFTNLTASNISASGTISGSTLHGTTSVTSPIGSFTQLSASQVKQGQITNVTGIFSHAEGYNTLASGNHSHAEGKSSTAAGEYTHAEGYNTYSTGSYTHAEGWETTSSGISSHAEGWSTRTIGQASHAEGYATLASGSYSHAEGYSTTASGDYQHVSGKFNVTSSNENDLFIIGNGTSAGARSNILVVNTSSVIVNGNISASGTISGSTIRGTTSVTSPIGNFTNITASNSFVQGLSTVASGVYSHAQGSQTAAVGQGSHAEGQNTTASGEYSHAEGYQTNAEGNYSHAEGSNTQTDGYYSHAEGAFTTASGAYSHAEGQSTIASANYQHVSGKLNVASSNTNDLFIIGNGTSVGSRSNILVVNTSSVIVGGSISASGQIYGYVTDEFMVAVSDEISNIASGSNKLQFIFPFALTGSSLTAYVHTAPVGSFITCSARIIGGSTISASISGSNKSGSASTTYYINKYQEVAIDIDQVGSTTAGKGLKLIFEGTRRI